MGPADVATILVSLIAAAVAIATNRSSSKASTLNVSTSGRVEMEKEAYERARKLDTETIERQDHEMEDLQQKNEKLDERLEHLQDVNRQLNEDVARISQDNYDLHKENRRVIEMSERVLADNGRLRQEVGALRERVTRIQRGIPLDSHERVRERETDTNPMGEYRNGRE